MFGKTRSMIKTTNFILSDGERDYLNSIGQYSVLSHDEQIELGRKIQAGLKAQELIDSGDNSPQNRRLVRLGKQAEEKFMLHNLKLVFAIAKGYPPTYGMELSDFIQEGNLGLRKAVLKYNPESGYKFSTYATFWIRQAIGRAIDKKNQIVYIPADHLTEYRYFRKDHEDFFDDKDVPYSLKDIHPFMKMKSLNTELLARSHGVLDKPMDLGDMCSEDFGHLSGGVSQGLGIKLYNEIEDQDAYEHTLDTLSEYLSDFEMWILQIRASINPDTNKPYSFAAIGKLMGVSQEAARRAYRRALNHAHKVVEFKGIEACSS